MKRQKKTKTKVNQKWFDLNPKKMRTNIINYDKMFSKYPKDLYIEITFTNHRENIIKQENKHIVNIRSLYKEFGNFVITLIESVRNLTFRQSKAILESHK
jgi:hypothetical protein